MWIFQDSVAQQILKNRVEGCNTLSEIVTKALNIDANTEKHTSMEIEDSPEIYFSNHVVR